MKKKARIRVNLLPAIHKREQELKEIGDPNFKLSITDIAEGAEVSWKTVYNLLNKQQGRFDGEPIARICRFLGVPEGEPVPFMTVEYYNNGNDEDAND